MVYEFGGGAISPHIGGIYEFLYTKKMETLRELERKNPVKPSAAKVPEKQLKIYRHLTKNLKFKQILLKMNLHTNSVRSVTS